MSPSVIRQTGIHSALTAILLLFFGWYAGFTVDPAQVGPVYAGAVTLFNWTLRIGGVALLVVCVVCLLGEPKGVLLDAIIAALAGLIFLSCALIWMIKGSGIDLLDLLVFASACILLGGARRSFNLWRSGLAPVAGFPVVNASPPESQAPHPASIRPMGLPTETDPPPEDGFLAALGREKDEPPPDSFR